MGSVMLGLNQEIKWPNYCVFCNKEAHDWSMTSSTKLLGIIGVKSLILTFRSV